MNNTFCRFQSGLRLSILPAMETWRDRARRAMKAASYTQEKLAEALDMTQGGIQHWLSGTRQPSLDDINRIAGVLNVSPVWMTHGVSESRPFEDLPEPARNALETVLNAQRKKALPDSFWHALDAMTRAVSPEASEAPQRNGTHD